MPLRPTRVRIPGKSLGAGIIALCLIAGSGCQAPGPRFERREIEPMEELAGSPFDPTVSPKYVLCPADELLIRFPNDPTLDQDVRIRSDGLIALPYIDSIRAAQRSPEELAAELNERYASVLKSGSVAVIVKEETGRRVFLGGEVRTPGALSLQGGRTLTQALFEVGGLTDHGRADQVLVVRVRPKDATYVLRANVDAILTGREPDVRLDPFDLVYVPETSITKVNRFVEQYINRMIPTPISFPFTTELHAEPVRVFSNGQSNIPPVTISR